MKIKRIPAMTYPLHFMLLEQGSGSLIRKS